VTDATELAGDGARTHPQIFYRYDFEGDRKYTAGRDDEKGIARHSGQPHLVDRNFGKHCTLHRTDGGSDQFEENFQVDLTVHAAKCSTEPLSIPAFPALGPVSKVAVRLENKNAAEEERMEASLVHLRKAHHET
jgi:hypothetical protein